MGCKESEGVFYGESKQESNCSSQPERRIYKEGTSRGGIRRRHLPKKEEVGGGGRIMTIASIQKKGSGKPDLLPRSEGKRNMNLPEKKKDCVPFIQKKGGKIIPTREEDDCTSHSER